MSGTSLNRTVRRAKAGDIEDIARLLERDAAPATAADIGNLIEDGQFLVLDRPGGGLAGGIHVTIEDGCGRFDHLVVAADAGADASADSDQLPRRLVSVAELVCQAEGCASVELAVDSAENELSQLCRSLGYARSGSGSLMAKQL